MVSDSSDNDLGYDIPHSNTRHSDSTQKRTNIGGPTRPIKIPDVSSAGTADQPIWISDVDTDHESVTTDVAVRGKRKSKAKPGRDRFSPNGTPAPRKRSKGKRKDPPTKEKVTKVKPKSKTKKATTPVEPPAHMVDVPIESNNPFMPRTEKQTAENATTSDISQEKMAPPVKKDTSESEKEEKDNEVDVSNFAVVDPDLERELEEITLDGRSGLISGTPAAYDIEKGARKSFPKPRVPIIEEEDSNFHTLLKYSKTKHERRQKMYLLLSVAGLVTITICLIAVLAGNRNSNFNEQALSSKQQQMEDVLSKLTDSSMWNNPATPQFKARRWLLFEDKEIKDFSEDRVVQRYSLACFFFATSGDGKWIENNWLAGNECADQPWDGLSCNSEGAVRAVVFDDQGLSGTIPSEIGHLSRLEHIILKNNPGLFGWIPTTLGHIRSLSQVGLYNNALSGTIPNIFEHANQIRYLNLEDNNMYGSIPMGVENLARLDTLALANNSFDGAVPLGKLSRTPVRYLSLSGNGFSSILEHSIKDMKSLEHLYIDHNNMKGPIPREIGALTNLKSLDLGHNQFTGELPTDLGRLGRLEFLSFSRNNLEGAVPVEMSLLTNLKTLELASNELTGSLPNVSNMVRLVNLQLFENKFSGSIPTGLLQLQSIEILFLSSNLLTGTLPRNIDLLGRTLRGLYLSDNKIQGRIPTELCNFQSLEALFLDSNDLFGAIPECLGQLDKLQQLYLFQNQLSGEVPASFGELRELTGLGLEENGLTGEMPNGVCGLVNEFSLDIWADCTDQFGSDPLLCDCCSVCCPSDQCV